MSDPRDYKLDIAGLNVPHDTEDGSAPGGSGRPYLRVLFACCNIYVRVYRNPEASQYAANCPRCGKGVRFKVGEGGTDSRDFVVR